MTKKKSKQEKKSKKQENMQEKIDELTDLLKRTQADFINYKNRAEKEARQLIEYCNSDVIKDFLPIIDSFELALKSTNENTDFKKGIEMVYAQMLDAIKKHGVEPIHALGKKFDPHLHEVMLKEKSNKPEDTIIQELQKGYMLKDKVIRHTKVKISGK